MRIDHRRRNIGMTQQFLNRAESSVHANMGAQDYKSRGLFVWLGGTSTIEKNCLLAFDALARLPSNTSINNILGAASRGV
jgi:hypothetical protein